MATLSNHLKNRMLDSEYGGTAATPVATFYYGLMTTLPAADGSGGVEVSGGSYARASLANNSTNFPAAAAGVKTGAVGEAVFPTPSAGWASVIGVCEFDAASGGNMRKFVPITLVNIASGGSVKVRAVDLSLTIT